MKKIVCTLAIFAVISISGKLFGQTATPAVTRKQVTQEARIQDGKQSGELTRQEKRRLQAQQAKVQHDKRVAKSDGVVTPEERKKLHREQRRASRNIYRQKHDEQTK